MRVLFASLLATILFGTLAGAHRTMSRSHHRSVARHSVNKAYVLQDFYQAEDFFGQWSFFDYSDPTGGNVNYLSMEDAMSQGLAYVDDCDNSTVLAVDSRRTVPVGGNRNSVRITSNKNYTTGLFILDAARMPTGCGVWPSFWMVGPNWPYGGEIDIVEGVNNQEHNQMTLHSGTSKACTLAKSVNNNTAALFTGNLLGTDCHSTPTADAGCGISDPNATSFARGFNNANGGVFALEWDTQVGMSIWHFARSDIPADITNRTPTPANWGIPVGHWSSQTCDIEANFYEQSLIFDTTICGNWANSAYGTSGCPGTCSEMVANATNFEDAKWVINSVAVYQYPNH